MVSIKVKFHDYILIILRQCKAHGAVGVASHEAALVQVGRRLRQ
jgi:hypothetical protein